MASAKKNVTEAKKETEAKAGKKAAAKTAEKKTPGRKPAAAKAEEKKVEAEEKLVELVEEKAAETTAAEGNAAEGNAVEEKAVEEKAVEEKAADKKAADKKATGRKAAKAELKSGITLQFGGNAYTQDELVQIAKDVWAYDLNQDIAGLASVELYVKPEEHAAYYVMNKGMDNEFAGSFYI